MAAKTVKTTARTAKYGYETKTGKMMWFTSPQALINTLDDFKTRGMKEWPKVYRCEYKQEPTEITVTKLRRAAFDIRWRAKQAEKKTAGAQAEA